VPHVRTSVCGTKMTGEAQRPLSLYREQTPDTNTIPSLPTLWNWRKRRVPHVRPKRTWDENDGRSSTTAFAVSRANPRYKHNPFSSNSMESEEKTGAPRSPQAYVGRK
jgi:hypothetical protein